MNPAFAKKQEELRLNLSHLTTKEAFYEYLMDLGKSLEPYPQAYKTDEHLVSGCQSIMYLHATMVGKAMHFQAASDALISAGLAALLLSLYNGETPETILKYPPKFLEELGLATSLTPGRANGFASLYLKMKQAALKAIVASERNNES